ncbi:MAG TPA: HEPN domain-containing protein [Ktedonobacterales bacterium]|jgi:HEPN domain-containing protein|nr:HEPN domain-containing protein [Ktedonobacterales bacterium]
MSQDEALGVWAEAAQDMASAGLAAGMGSTYNCADLCNQVAEKALQALYILRNDRRAPYNHDLRALGELVAAPPEILADLDALTPYHPEGYLAGRTPEEADDEITGETAADLMARARTVLRWARQYVMA